MHIVEGILCQKKERVRSLLCVSEKTTLEIGAKSTHKECEQRVHIVEGILCQKKERVRSLLIVNEELAL